MLLRAKSKESSRTVTPPGPSYMSSEQFAEYLADLRNNRVARPSGARPPPPSKRRQSIAILSETTPQAEAPPVTPAADLPSRPGSSFSRRQSRNSIGTYSSAGSRTGRALVQPPPQEPPLKPSEVVPSATYIERGLRWMEKEEAVSLREAMEDMDLKKQHEEELRIHAAAQEEASELVYKHQFGEPIVNPDAPYRYNDHLKKNSYARARTQSVNGGPILATGLARDIAPPQTASSASGAEDEGEERSDSSKNSSPVQRKISPERVFRGSLDTGRDAMAEQAASRGSPTRPLRSQNSRRKSGGGKRNISGEIKGSFTGEQIWEEPEPESAKNTLRGRPAEARDVPSSPLQAKPRNPLNRVQFMPEGPRSNSTPPEVTKRFSSTEIYKNPPSQSRDPAYTANPPPSEEEVPKIEEIPKKNGIEIRGEDIRQATSMRLKDRSPKLPTPTAVSDKPGRPIVSFDKNWKPSEADDKPEVRRRSPFDRRPNSKKQDLPARPGPTPAQTPTVKNFNAPTQVSVSVPSINVSESTPSVPTINFPDTPHISVSAPKVPTIVEPTSSSSRTPAVPTIIEPGTSPSKSAPVVPTINIPAINEPGSGSKPSIPTISQPSSSQSTARPLPDPKTASKRTFQRQAPVPVPRGHWSPAIGGRATATCHQCQLPIEGRVVALRGVAERFHPECFICFTCGTALEALEISPEPAAARTARLDRIKRREQGEIIPEIEGQTEAEDGDVRLRFFCHLDWHEAYAPRCKHCKTPIIGEHAVALGEHWHYGHFFCAECGDPFEQGMTHIEKDGYAWCLSCQTKRTERKAPKCKRCRKAVLGQYVEALGGEWHDECFRCGHCSGGFDDGQIFPCQRGNKGEGGEIIVLCTGCMEKELKA
ncbi:LIM domain-containing protein [Rutstroemia sp. NJR-2017a BVV2]|nr:LIM domain-containing protein [Rutstroemia sp. NJR-2017a BVV2]